MWYNTKQMEQYGYWKRKRGLANSKSVETAFFCYFAKPPKNMPKTRKYVDAGSSLFHAGMRAVPVLAPKWHAFVSGEVQGNASRAWREFRTTKTRRSWKMRNV